MQKSTHEEIIETVNKLFIYTDYQQWDKLKSEVFTELVDFDMSSLGGVVAQRSRSQICEEWQKGFKDLDAINHLAGNHIITLNGETAKVFCYATATHYKKSAKKGETREFIGSYDLSLIKEKNGWRINKFKYNMKYALGNLELK